MVSDYALGADSKKSRQLVERIQELLRKNGGWISFAEYMSQVLYAPGIGYYANNDQQLGGDFVTAPEISPLFGRCLARLVAPLLETLEGQGAVLEVGAGSGVLAAELLASLADQDRLPDRYLILDLSAELRERQRMTLAQRVPHLLGRVGWIDDLPASPWRGVVVANELLDALPVERFRLTEQGPVWLGVGWKESGFCWQEQAITSPVVVPPWLASLGESLAPGYTSELALAAPAWVRSMGERLAQGAILLVDYGYPRGEYYHPQRHDGTLACYYRHHYHDNPLILPGLQDITAHVEWTGVAEAALEVGLMVAGYTNQAQFLLDAGLPALLAKAAERADDKGLSLANQVRRLTLPQEMGELFKAMLLTRGIEGRWPGFRGRDFRDRL